MLAAALVGLWIAQAAGLPTGAAGPFTPSVKEWSLGGAFKLKQEHFLRWAPVYDPLRGWRVELRSVWLVELTPTHPRLSGLSLALASTPAPAEGGVGVVRPRLQYRVSERTRLGVELPVATLVNTGSGVGMRVFRPFAFVSGRF